MSVPIPTYASKDDNVELKLRKSLEVSLVKVDEVVERVKGMTL